MSEIMITLQQIRDQPPCEEGWEKVYNANKGDMTTPFPLKSIIDSNDLADCLWALRCLPKYDNLWRLYAVWCARQVEHLMTDARSKSALDVAERFANGDATQEELSAAVSAASDAWAASAVSAASAAASAVSAARDAASDAARSARDAAWAAWAAFDARSARAASDAIAAQKAKLIEILTAGEWV